MRFLFLGNNLLGVRVLRFLCERGTPPVGLALHPPERAKHRSELLAISEEYRFPVFDGSRLRNAAVREEIRSLEAELAVSILFGFILKPRFISMFPRGVINLHPAFLPYNRGQYPNVWSIVDRTPAGVTLHYIDAGIDTGDIVAQREVDVTPTDTGRTLYDKLEQAGLDLFTETWTSILAGNAPRVEQTADSGTFHYTRDVDTIDRIDLDRTYRAGDLIDILRARTFAPYRGAYFVSDGRKVFLRLELVEEDE